MSHPHPKKSAAWLRALGSIDRFGHPDLLADPSTATKFRGFAIAVLAAMLVVMLASARDLILGDLSRVALSLTSTVLILANLHYLKSSGKLTLCSHLFLTTIAITLIIRMSLPTEGSQVAVLVVTFGLLAALLISSRAGLLWTSVGTSVAIANAVRLTQDGSPETDVAWAVAIVTVAVGAWSCTHAAGRELTRALTNQAMRKAGEERDRLRFFAESAFPGIIEVAPGEIDYASRGVQQLLGYDVDEFTKRGLQEYVHPDDFWPVVETLQGAPNKVAQVEARLRHANGHWVWIAAFAIPYSRFADDEDRWIFAARDVGRERQDRELGLQAERLEGVGLLAAGVAHDFNNLLTVIAGHAELLDSGDERSGILLAADEAAALTSRLLSFSQEQPREISLFDFKESLENLQPFIRSLLGEQIELNVALVDQPCFLLNDPTQLNQVVLNLVTNARDAMPDGGTLDISVAKEQLDSHTSRELGLASDNVITLSIRDDGSGMDSETLAQAFDPFFTTKEGERGTGLGLASAYRLAKRCGGHLHLESEPEVGTTAILRIPEEEPSEALEVRSDPVLQSPEWQGWILVVEDDPEIRRLMCGAFEQIGVTTRAAADGEQALQVFATQPEPPTMLITDVIMPGIKGSVVAEKLKLKQPDLKVLFVSGYSDVKLDPWYENDPSVSFLAKPFRPSQLIQAANRLLARSEALY